MYQPGDIIQWCWHNAKQQSTSRLRVLGTYQNYYYHVIDLDTNEESFNWEIVGSPSGYWKKCLTPTPPSAKVPLMDEPQVGDIWQWDHEWTVLLTKRLPSEDWEDAPVCFMGIALEDGWHGKWEFSDKINPLWEKLA